MRGRSFGPTTRIATQAITTSSVQPTSNTAKLSARRYGVDVDDGYVAGDAALC
jgi:hypothetical protein